ncbi:hypothetical protein VNI00_006385 [Paramarasmius palmivorus]|uniref:WSC domain-containing protein n=1 Tax=Paramarasmius palmivorus TaxID=297713 RepID=A0AAW0D7D7_9AGAR
MSCTGNGNQACGGPNRLNVYNYTGSDLPTPSGPNSGASQGGSTPRPVSSGLPAKWTYFGCYSDNEHGRIMEYAVGSNEHATVEKCISICKEMSYTIAGIEYGGECYCADRLINGAEKVDDSACSMGCSGNASEGCGGPNRLSVYATSSKIITLPAPEAQSTNLSGKWSYDGCYTDNPTRVLPWKIVWGNNNTVSSCLKRCAAFGYTAAGLEFGEECHCGDSSDIASRDGQKVPESECSIVCSGDPTHFCGGGLRLQMYTWKGTVNVWHEPEVKGRYEFFVPGVVVPLIATLGINNKVTFLEKSGTGPPNSTGAYELDLTLAHDSNRAWREMHVKTDVFCSGSIILPDKAGRQLNVGGWSADSLSGVRLYTPDGAPGENSTNDWEENVDLLSLQRPRWYPTAAMLPNGSVLVIGGEIGSNAAAQPNLEILPKPEGGHVVNLGWLDRTDPNNLYPFVVVLPSGRLFVAYYNEARILDSQTFDTVKVLPNIPGAVNNFEGGRSYPLQGAAGIFPQAAPYTDLLRILICGGSTAVPLDNCVSIEPEADDPNWIIERMPTRRVMPNLTALPDGTFLITGGAQQGVAGFNLASHPNLDALLYDPKRPPGRRISILNTTSVPRLYHSEAVLLPDSRVLISGSDPQSNGFTEEYRIEASKVHF